MLERTVVPTGGPAPGPRFRRAVAVAGAVAVMSAGLAAPALADDLPAQDPGVTMRTFQLAQDPGAVCTLRSATTPNVDRLMPTIDWRTDEEFGASDNFITHVLGYLHVPADGEYGLRVTNDDGALVYLDDQLVLENDGPQDSTSVETTLTLTEGAHDLRIEHYEGGFNQRLSLYWRPPGATSFELVPTSALSTDAGVVRVTSPGVKFCEGATDTPGDGLRLFDVNPNYELVDLRPEGFAPAVSALDFTEDGDLVVVTAGQVSPGGWQPDPYTGEVYILEGAQDAEGPEDVSYRLVHDGLFNPMGVDVIGDSIFVSERDGLTELVPDPAAADPETADYVRNPEYEDGKFATWPDGGNFHEFAFGLVHDDENFYLNLSVAINNGGASTNPQPAPNRGTTIAVDRETGEVEFLAGGLRTPNGIGWGGTNGDDLFVMDNQGDWLPSSKLVHIKPGRFFNHYTNPPGPFDDQPVTPPVVWIPQNEIGNSPSAPVQLTEGPFAGQMLFGDVTYGGLQRAFLEEVEGEYQGAVFRHSAGLEAGVNRTIVGPDGAIYVGGIGEGGNWGESGKLRYGLQKLEPVGEDTFDIAEMRLADGGFELEYTQPLSEETAARLAEAYQVTQWRYVPTSSYGGPKVGEEALLVTGAELSDDGTTVTVSIDGLKPGHVVHIRSPRPFEDVDGQELWSTEAWYTLNALPGYVGPADRGYYEAEEATLLGGANTHDEHNGYSGTGFAQGIQQVGAEVRFDVSVDEAGTHPIHLRYANGPHPSDMDKTVSLYVNGEKVGPWLLPRLGDWKTWATVSRDVELDAGANTIAIRYDEDDDGHVNLDVLSVGDPDICEPITPDEGYTALFDGTLESFADWRLAGAGSFGRYEDCSLRTSGGMGLLWYAQQEFGDYSLKLDWKLVKDDNGGVFVGFPDPGNDPWVAVDQGYEIQIDASDAADRTTGAIYTFQGADPEAVEQALNPVGSWNSYEIVVDGDTIKVILNGVLVNDFTSTDPARDLSSGFIGIQNHGGGETVFYRDVQVKELTDEPAEPVHVPVDKVSVQLYSLIPWVGQAGLEPVLARLAEIGLENVEPFGGNFSGYTAEEFRALTDLVGLAVPSSHYDVGEAGFDRTLEFVGTLGQEYVGSGGFAAPGIGSYEDTLATAETLNRLGERAVAAGVGKVFGHNHAGEFTTRYMHDGEEMAAWEILVAETDPEYVTFELDVAWAADAGIDVPALLEEHGERIELLHIKDATNLDAPGNPAFTNLGEGDVDLQAILMAAEEHADIAYYVLEYDLAPRGEEFVTTGFEYLTGQEAGEAGSRPVEVTPHAVTFADEDGTADDAYTVPRTPGVEYILDGAVVTAGTYPGTGTVSVTARARAGFELAGVTTWTHTFSTDDGAPTDPAAGIAQLQQALAAHVAAGDVAGPIAGQLEKALEQAAMHLEGQRTTPALRALERFVTHLDNPKRPDTLAAGARAELRGTAEVVIGLLG
ncbi:MAG TPA: family 16 glycoside hydrolase [Phototrophicaceae bacterium]|nr:family 16 glycoside hydrolase [Phototrophicaceae bacterium]